ncbi:hypothetical protein JKG47_12900 [Acidithiobacillus sp. MC6.1]|nr:hypothetical protein [Acidithiobacillus sp. MC6.1]
MIIAFSLLGDDLLPGWKALPAASPAGCKPCGQKISGTGDAHADRAPGSDGFFLVF